MKKKTIGSCEAGLRFIFDPQNEHRKLRLHFVDAKGVISSEIAYVETMNSMVYLLTPRDDYPWFQIMDGVNGENRFIGRWRGHPDHSSKEFMTTGEIISATTITGEAIEVWQQTTRRLPCAMPSSLSFH